MSQTGHCYRWQCSTENEGELIGSLKTHSELEWCSKLKEEWAPFTLKLLCRLRHMKKKKPLLCFILLAPDCTSHLRNNHNLSSPQHQQPALCGLKATAANVSDDLLFWKVVFKVLQVFSGWKFPRKFIVKYFKGQFQDYVSFLAFSSCFPAVIMLRNTWYFPCPLSKDKICKVGNVNLNFYFWSIC